MVPVLLLTEEILQTTGYIQPCDLWDKLPIDRWFRIFAISIAGILGISIGACQTVVPFVIHRGVAKVFFHQ